MSKSERQPKALDPDLVAAYQRAQSSDRSCPKRRYATKKDATTAANARTHGRSDYRHNRPDKLRAYECPRCKGWHLTHKDERD